MAANAIEIHPAALSEVKSALAWYSERSTAAADEFLAELDRAVDLIAESPQRWPVGEHGTRKFVLHHFPFAIIYRQTRAGVQILAIAHGHRRPGYWQRR